MPEEKHYGIDKLEKMSLAELYDLAKDRHVKNYKKLKKNELVDEILDFEKAMSRRVEVRVASTPLELTDAPRHMAPLAYGDSDEKEDDENGAGLEVRTPPVEFIAPPAPFPTEPIAPRHTAKRSFPSEPEAKRSFPSESARSFEKERDSRPQRITRPRTYREIPEPVEPEIDEPQPGDISKHWSFNEPMVKDEISVARKGPAIGFEETDLDAGEESPGLDIPSNYDFDASRERTTVPGKFAQDERDRRPGAVRGRAQEGEVQKGVLDIHPDGTYGFVRQKEFRYGSEDIYVSISQIKKFGLRTGDVVEGTVRPPRDQERYKSLVKIDRINEFAPEENRRILPFENLVPIYPDQRLFLECDAFEISTRLIDLFSPIGRGQRCIIVAKPKAGKTILLKKIAASIAKNHPDIELIALLIDERPEEVTDFERNIQGLVISSTFDEKPENHIQTAELCVEYARRRVEQGKDVMILLDSLTRLARSYNLTCPPSGKTLSGGLDPNSLYKPKRFLGAARNIEHGGSLTIISSALIETGSRLDDIIYEEFKGTANSEIHLVRELADKRIFPALDLLKSGTRHEELLYNPDEMDCLWQLRKMIADMDEAERMNRLINKLIKTKSNVELLLQVQKAVDTGY